MYSEKKECGNDEFFHKNVKIKKKYYVWLFKMNEKIPQEENKMRRQWKDVNGL